MMTTTDKHHDGLHTTRQTGFSMIEIAIALLVLSIGLLGIAGLQSSGMQASFKSQQRTIAMNQAQDLADRIRANLSGLRAMEYTKAIPTSVPSPNCSASANTCTPAELAATDLYNWEQSNAELLPAGAGEISCTDIDAVKTPNIFDAGSSCQITVRWDANRDGATGTGCDPTNTGAGGDLACLRMRLIP